MKNLILALLTTLFVSAMPLQAAYAWADDAVSKEACSTTYNDLFVPETLDKIKAQNGTIVEIDGVRVSAFQSRVEEAVGSAPEWKADKIVIVNPDGEEASIVNVAFFVDNCLKAILHLPQVVVDTFLSPLETKPGERVD